MTFLVILLIAIVVHETMHALVAHKLGDSTSHDMGRITLNPLAHIDLFTTVLLPIVTFIFFQAPILAAKPVMVDPRNLKYGDMGWALVSIAGPLSNMAMAALAAGLIHLGIVPDILLQQVVWFIWLNIGMFVFNMLPIPPLDGSRLLRALAPEPMQDLMDRFEQMGFAVAIFLLILLMNVISPLLSNISIAIWRLLF